MSMFLFSYCQGDLTMTFFSLADDIGNMSTVCSHCNSNDCKAEFNSGENDNIYNVVVWAYICE